MAQIFHCMMSACFTFTFHLCVCVIEVRHSPHAFFLARRLAYAVKCDVLQTLVSEVFFFDRHWIVKYIYWQFPHCGHILRQNPVTGRLGARIRSALKWWATRVGNARLMCCSNIKSTNLVRGSLRHSRVRTSRFVSHGLFNCNMGPFKDYVTRFFFILSNLHSLDKVT